MVFQRLRERRAEKKEEKIQLRAAIGIAKKEAKLATRVAIAREKQAKLEREGRLPRRLIRRGGKFARMEILRAAKEKFRFKLKKGKTPQRRRSRGRR